MVITSTQERPVQAAETERVRPAVPPETLAAVHRQPSIWVEVEVEEADAPAAPTGWITRFAWAKTAGGW
jgi:hypothetical protein